MPASHIAAQIVDNNYVSVKQKTASNNYLKKDIECD
jgi:hypothetical protein